MNCMLGLSVLAASFLLQNNQLLLAQREEYNGQTQTAGLELRPSNLET